MKLSQFRRIIKEEVKKILSEDAVQGTYKNGIYTGGELYIFEPNPAKVAEVEKKFGEFIKVTGPIDTSGPVKTVPVELDVKALIKFVQAGKLKSFGVYGFRDAVTLYLKDEDAITGFGGDDITINNITPAVIKVLEPYHTKLPQADFVTVQIAPNSRDYDFESGDYGTIDDYQIPTIIQTKLAGKRPAQGADDREIRRYVFQVRNQLTPQIKTVFPDAKFWDISVGGIGYRLTAAPTSQQKSKLKSLLKGALSIDFIKSYVND